MNYKNKKLMSIAIVSLAVILVIEIFYFGIKIYHNRKVSTFYTVVSSVILDNESTYVGAGFSDYRHSKFNKFDKGYDKATMFKVKNGKIVKEAGLKLGLNSHFNDVVEVKDGYVAVGKIEMNEDQQKEGITEGLIAKFDKNFKLIWRKNVSILEKTELYKVKLDGDDLVIVGTSVYSEGYVGNHTTGGGILLKYSLDGKQKLKVNNGGPYSGSFNDILIEKDSYVVVGLGRKNSGIIIKYNKNGKKLKSGSFGYTDKNGINAVAKKGNNYITAATKVVNPKDLSNYSAAIVEFNSNLEKIDDVKYTSDKITYFSDIELDKDENVFVCGYTGSAKENGVLTDAIVVKYDKDLYEKSSNVLKGKKNDFYSKIYLKDSNIYLLGYSNSKLKEFKTNGYDYYPVLKKYNNNLK